MNARTAILLRTVSGLALSALSGLLFTLAFPPFDLWPLIFIGFVPAIIAQHRVMPRRLSGLAYGVAFGGFYWGYFGPMFYGTNSIIEWVPLFAGVLASMASSGDRAFNHRTGYRWFVLSGAVVWVGIEAIRALLPMIGTGGSVAFALYSQPWFIQPVGIFGIFGLGLLIMLANYAVALGALSLIDARWLLEPGLQPVSRKHANAWAVATLAALILWSGLSIDLVNEGSVPGSSVTVAAIQPGPSQGQEAHTRKLLEQTREAAAQGAQLVVWPEGALNFDPQVQQTERFRAVARETGVYLTIGYAVRTDAGMRNEAVLVSPEGEFLGVYGKDHPVVWLGEQSSTRGSYPVYSTPFGRIGTIICYDLNFTDTARKTASNGAQIIAVSSNDWPEISSKQYTNLVMRAVENGITLVKADTLYDSAIIDPSGRIVAKAVYGVPGQTTLITTVPLGKADAPLIALGDWLGWLCIIGIAVFTALNILTGRRPRSTRLVPVITPKIGKLPLAGTSSNT